jgi:hypothetical protein
VAWLFGSTLPVTVAEVLLIIDGVPVVAVGGVVVVNVWSAPIVVPTELTATIRK